MALKILSSIAGMLSKNLLASFLFGLCSWCGPCRLLDPIIRQAVEKSGAVTLIRVDVDSCPKISSEYQIASIPCVVALKNGQTVDKFVGALPKNAVKDFVEKHAARA
ncbi:hypothetical protein BGZ58_001418 [Dissophora ornata]|nr:hypothetical protein BGZ58_001418 [Dissophora ornata]